MESVKDILRFLLGIIASGISIYVIFKYLLWIIRKSINRGSQNSQSILKLFSFGLGLSILHLLFSLTLAFVIAFLIYASGNWNSDAGNIAVSIFILGLIAIWGSLIYRRFLSERINEKITAYYKKKMDNDYDDY